jgi:hypothetical protein
MNYLPKGRNQPELRPFGGYMEYWDLIEVRRAMRFAKGEEYASRSEAHLYEARLVLVNSKDYDGTIGSAILVLSNAKFKVVA